jgi:hypothetical protein
MRIIPTEDGWQIFGKNRDIGRDYVGILTAKIIITSSNAEPIEKEITIKPANELKNDDPLFQ